MIYRRCAILIVLGLLVSAIAAGAAAPSATNAQPRSNAPAAAGAECGSAPDRCVYFPWMRTPPIVPRIEHVTTLPGYAEQVEVHNEYAYVGISDTLQIVGINNPQQPVVVGQHRFAGRRAPYVVGLDVHPPYVYATTRDHFTSCCIEGTFNILSVDNPAAPILRDSVSSSGFADVVVDNNRAYVLGAIWIYLTTGVTIFDVANPDNIVQRSTYGYYGGSDIVVNGSIAYLARPGDGVLVLDVSNPDAPVLLGTVATSSAPYDLELVGTMLYVADTYAGLTILDVSTPTQPVLRGSRATNGFAIYVQVVDDRAYVAQAEEGLAILDVSDPDDMQLLATFDTPGLATDLEVVGDLVYLADGAAGLHILRMVE